MHAMHTIRSIATNVACSVLWMSVLVTLMYCAKTAESIEIPFGGMTYVCSTNRILDGIEVPHGKGQFWGLSDALKSIGSLCCSVCSKRSHSLVNNGMQRKASITTQHAMWSFVKILWRVVSNFCHIFQIFLHL